MEFSYKVSEADYLAAWKVRTKSSSRASVIKTVAFWIFILICLMLLFSVIQHGAQQPTMEPVAPPPSAFDKLLLAWPLGFLALLAFVKFWFLPMRLRRMYRKDPSMQGKFTVNITSTSISTQNAAGTSSQCGWNIYDYWREGKGVIVLVFHSGAYFILSLAGLTEPQRSELRGILTSALPKK